MEFFRRHKPITVNLTPLSSSFINVPFEHDSSTNVLIRMNSNNDQCMGAIVQHLQVNKRLTRTLAKLINREILYLVCSVHMRRMKVT